ncbi:subtilisin-like protease SBT4.8 [Arachis duranensis]|uniref:Subtilisin-like protease SBT4.8 n=1 Tax=Arachis duranensis TaxID=130453 RepID=A0A6P4DQ55_ARADU|nr:subtilisin-like protease SBT4.8 [Arachis duranensis]
MANYSFLLFLYAYFIVKSLVTIANDANRNLHIVYMGSLPKYNYSPTSHHLSMLQQTTNHNDATIHMVRSYHKSFNGFAAMITNQEREKLKKMEGVVSVFPSKSLKLHTTRSWDFMGFKESIHRNKTGESDVIIGVIDTGIWPESESFNDHGFGPIPKKWKGACKGGKNFRCNKKIIGARYYLKDQPSTRDIVGHGSHTASIAAGNKVVGASFYGIAEGAARGGVPSARIAAYSVCSEQGCTDDAILAAFDDAIADGVDLITISIGADEQMSFDKDIIAIGSFHAMEKGILTIHSAGNNGPNIVTFSVSPWLFTVAATTMDRRLIDNVLLGNGLMISGKSINGFASNGTKIPLIHGKFASSPTCPSEKDAEFCFCLDPKRIKGKIVLCRTSFGYSAGLELGAFGSIAISYEYEAQVVSYPAVGIDPEVYDVVLSYANSTTTPSAEILSSAGFINNSAPIVAEFSSVGPNMQIKEIMKPDISAPGIEILAAYSPLAPPSPDKRDKRSVKYNILSGTSMSCPHVAGAAAYVKTFHPDWSPAAIKSSLMTTAKPMNGSELAEFSYGSGFLDPVRAINPGLVFDASKDDYVNLLCRIGYDTMEVRKISGDKSVCSSSSLPMAKDFNYPAIVAEIEPMKPFMINFTRTVTNVGFANSTYKAYIQQHSGINITVVPNILKFKCLKEKQSFVVHVVGEKFSDFSLVSSSLSWTDGTHSVRCPLILRVIKVGA